MKLVENVSCFEAFKLSSEYKRQKYESRMLSKWVAITPYNLQSDILSVYDKALAYSMTVRSNQLFLEASSLRKNDFNK